MSCSRQLLVTTRGHPRGLQLAGGPAGQLHGTNTTSGRCGTSQCSLACLWDHETSRAMGQESRERQRALAQPKAAGLSRLFVKHQPLFVMTPIKFPSACLTRGTQSKSRETDESAIGLLAVACLLPVDFHASKSKLKASSFSE